MHIADGVLPVSVSLVGYALTLAGVGYSLRRLDSANLPMGDRSVPSAEVGATLRQRIGHFAEGVLDRAFVGGDRRLPRRAGIFEVARVTTAIK